MRNLNDVIDATSNLSRIGVGHFKKAAVSVTLFLDNYGNKTFFYMVGFIGTMAPFCVNTALRKYSTVESLLGGHTYCQENMHGN